MKKKNFARKQETNVRMKMEMKKESDGNNYNNDDKEKS